MYCCRYIVLTVGPLYWALYEGTINGNDILSKFPNGTSVSVCFQNTVYKEVLFVCDSKHNM